MNSGSFQKGQTPWNKGIKYTAITGEKHPMFGKHHTEETRQKISNTKKGKPSKRKGQKQFQTAGINNPNYGKFGKDHPKWTNNKEHSFQKSIRELFKYRQWRSDIFTRDNFTCVLCGIKGVLLQADHYPKSFIKILNEYEIQTIDDALSCEELWNINNGRTLCVPCHKKTETWGRQKIRSIL